jgi:hypothetical protein
MAKIEYERYKYHERRNEGEGKGNLKGLEAAEKIRKEEKCES